MTMVPELYYGTPDADHCCAYQYRRAGRRCPNYIDFYVKIEEGRGDDWRKAWAACWEHLARVIYQMQEAHGGYDGEYLLRVGPLPGPIGSPGPSA